MTVDLIYPEATPVQGNTSIVLLTSVADLDSVNLSTEILAPTSLIVSSSARKLFACVSRPSPGNEV